VWAIKKVTDNFGKRQKKHTNHGVATVATVSEQAITLLFDNSTLIINTPSLCGSAHKS
jgi:hypothetical protein